MECVEGDYWLPDALEEDIALAVDWLVERVRSASSCLGTRFHGERAVDAAIATLTTDQKRMILDQLQPDYLLVDFLNALVGDDTSLYCRFVRNQTLKSLHLTLLNGWPRNAITDEPSSWSGWIALSRPWMSVTPRSKSQTRRLATYGRCRLRLGQSGAMDTSRFVHIRTCAFAE